MRSVKDNHFSRTLGSLWWQPWRTTLFLKEPFAAAFKKKMEDPTVRLLPALSQQVQLTLLTLTRIWKTWQTITPRYSLLQLQWERRLHLLNKVTQSRLSFRNGTFLKAANSISVLRPGHWAKREQEQKRPPNGLVKILGLPYDGRAQQRHWATTWISLVFQNCLVLVGGWIPCMVSGSMDASCSGCHPGKNV